ncbi:MIP/aquaporin family protein [Pseudactinotalea sp. Z1739]|uniref:MIP/aquaporin family protein n=1 Tax=Pseudactinotalea sp. Z1739 TaxID=3413028 RepID=UPI003C7A0CF6
MSEQPTTGPAAAPAAYPLMTRVAGEAAGTFILVFIGLGALLYSGTLREVDPLINALAFGVAFAAAIALFARVSGGHINPAISLGAAVKGQLGWGDLPAYWLGQLVGAIAAAAVLFATLPAGLATQVGASDQALFSQAANTFGDQSYLAQISGGQMSFGLVQVLLLEAVGAAVLTAVVLATSHRGRTHVAPVAAGLTLTGLILALDPVTGGGLNPARSTAAAIFAEPAVLGQLWLFWLAPMIGGGVAGLAYLLFAPTPEMALVEEDDWAGDDDWAGAEEVPDAEEVSGAAALPDLDAGERTTMEFDPDDAEPVAQVDVDEDEFGDAGADPGRRG